MFAERDSHQPFEHEVLGVLRRDGEDGGERLAGLGMTIKPTTPEAFGVYIKSEIERWAVVVKASGMKAE